MSWLNYHHLYYFYLVATEGGVAKAAEKLNLGQPALSTQLKTFESHLGVKLFEKQGRKLILTESGRLALKYAREIFKSGEEMRQVLHDQKLPDRTHVQLGALESVPKHLILKLAQAAYQQGPCTLTIVEGKSDELLRELSVHQIDLFLSDYAPSSFGVGGIVSRSLAKAPIVICGSKKFHHLKKDFPASLKGVPVILPTGHSKLRQDIEHFYMTNEIALNMVGETLDTSLQKLLGIEGYGLVIAPLFAVDEHLKNKELFEIGRLPGVFEELFLVSGSRKIQNPISGELFKTFRV